MPLPNVEDTHEFLFEDLELSELVEPFFTSYMVGGFKVNSFLHELVHFVIEERYFNDLTALFDMSGGTTGTDQDIFVFETLRTAADHMCFLIMFEA